MSNQQGQEQNLMLGDRINYPYILANALLKFQEAVVKVEGERSEQEATEAAMVIDAFIPDAWIKADEAFKKEREEAMPVKEVDARKDWCGRKVGKPKLEKRVVIDPYKLVHANINVFQRRGLLSKTLFGEKIVPDPEDLEKENNGTDNQDR